MLPRPALSPALLQVSQGEVTGQQEEVTRKVRQKRPRWDGVGSQQQAEAGGSQHGPAGKMRARPPGVEKLRVLASAR